MLTFTQYLRQRNKRRADSRILHDFLADFQCDHEWPAQDAGNYWQVYDDHLCRACDGAIWAFHSLYAEYLTRMAVRLHKAVHHLHFATLYNGFAADMARAGFPVSDEKRRPRRCVYCHQYISGIGDAVLEWYIDQEGGGPPSSFKIVHRHCVCSTGNTKQWRSALDDSLPGVYYEPLGSLAVFGKSSFPLQDIYDIKNLIGGDWILAQTDDDDLEEALDVVNDIQTALYYTETELLASWSSRASASKDGVASRTVSVAHKEKRLSRRFMVFRRDGYRCQICGRSAQDGATLEVDHKVPRSKGGSNDIDNLWTLCFECNRGKHAHDL